MTSGGKHKARPGETGNYTKATSQHSTHVGKHRDGETASGTEAQQVGPTYGTGGTNLTAGHDNH